jgi:hypothetical protein
MAVYIDNMNAPCRGMLMVHMIADTSEELIEMADKIGVNRKWIQDKGTYSEHFDICQTKKKRAVALGAKEITMMELGRMTAKRPGSPFYDRYKDEETPVKHENPNPQIPLF